MTTTPTEDKKLNPQQKAILDSALTFWSSSWAAAEAEIHPVIRGQKISFKPNGFSAYGAVTSTAISLATGDSFTKASFGAGLGFILGTVATAGLVGIGITAVPAAIGGAVIGGVITGIFGDSIYDGVSGGAKWTSTQITEAGKWVGKAVGDAITDFINHDWAGDFAKGKQAFENSFGTRYPEFCNDIKRTLSDFQYSSDPVKRKIWGDIDRACNAVKTTIWDRIIDSVADFTGVDVRKIIDLGRYLIDPIVLDLNGDGIKLTNAGELNTLANHKITQVANDNHLQQLKRVA